MINPKKYSALDKSWSKEQLATFLFEELHTEIMDHVGHDKYEGLAKVIIKGYISMMTKKEMILMLKNLNFDVEPEPNKEV